MRIEVGVDIIENIRFSDDLLSNKSFMNRCFTDKEREYCFSKQCPAQHFAARFAGKEAVVKALYGFGIKCRIENVEIINNDDGVPLVNVYGINSDLSGFEIKISLSHSESSSIAFATVYKLD